MTVRRIKIPRQDAVLFGLLGGTWAAAFLSLFGVEARSLFYIHNQEWIILGFPALLVILPFLIRHELARRLIRPRVPLLSGGSLRRQQEPAHPIIREHILARAVELGINEPIEIVRKPNSGGETNACVWSAGGHLYMSLTSKVERLFGAGRCGDVASMEQFEFLIDHELGHVWHRDTAVLLLARSILWCTILLIPLKLAVWYAMNWRYLMFDLARIFPPLTDGKGIVSGLALLDPSSAAIIFALFTSGTIALLWLFTRTLARRREYLADRFAFAHASNAGNALLALGKLLQHPAPHAAAAPSFLGGLASHPSGAARLGQLRQPSRIGRIPFEPLLLTLMVMIAGRFILTDTSNALPLDARYEIKLVLSVLYTALCSFLVGCLVNARADENLFRSSCRNALILVIWSIGFAVALATVLWTVARGVGSSNDPVAIIARHVEMVEWIMLCLSLPLVCASFAVGHIAASGFVDDGVLAQFARQASGLVVGTLLLMGCSALVAASLAQWQDELNGQIRDALEDRLAAAIACQQDTEADQARRDSCEQDASELADLVGLIDTQFIHTRFLPPETWIFLWQQPFRRPTRLA
jgi:hypothetical protein